MAHIPGYSPMADTNVSYPSTYNEARNAAFNSAAAPIGGNISSSYTLMEDSPQGG